MEKKESHNTTNQDKHSHLHLHKDDSRQSLNNDVFTKSTAKESSNQFEVSREAKSASRCIASSHRRPLEIININGSFKSNHRSSSNNSNEEENDGKKIQNTSNTTEGRNLETYSQVESESQRTTNPDGPWNTTSTTQSKLSIANNYNITDNFKTVISSDNTEKVQKEGSTTVQISQPRDSLKSETSNKDLDPSPKNAPSELLQQERPKGIVGYIIYRYTWYIEKLQQSLESEMPRTFRMFRIFGVGLKAFISDFTLYVRLLVSLSFPSVHLESLSRHELEVYHHMPWDMVKVFPVLLISAIPFGQNLALPIGYFFPRHLLCRHFWDITQTHDFSMHYLRKRWYNARPVFRSLQSQVTRMEHVLSRVRSRNAYHLLGSGRHPGVEEVMALRPLFLGDPYSIAAMRSRHRVSKE